MVARIICSIIFALLGLICNVSLYIAASCQCVEFHNNKTCVFVVVLLWAFIFGIVVFGTVSYDLIGCSHSLLDISGLYQTCFIFYTFVDALIFYPKWKQQTRQKNLNLFDYTNVCCDTYELGINSWQKTIATNHHTK